MPDILSYVIAQLIMQTNYGPRCKLTRYISGLTLSHIIFIGPKFAVYRRYSNAVCTIYTLCHMRQV